MLRSLFRYDQNYPFEWYLLCKYIMTVQGRHILCHKVVLASASEYFENMFRWPLLSHLSILSLNIEFKELR